tara:strand:+ start:1904 stop:2071 length:168 start_codon:yes stop_codon:yes gene_type:complete
LSFGGGGSGGSATVASHKHNSQSGEGGSLQFNNDIVTGSSMQVNGGSELPLEVTL